MPSRIKPRISTVTPRCWAGVCDAGPAPGCHRTSVVRAMILFCAPVFRLGVSLGRCCTYYGIVLCLRAGEPVTCDHPAGCADMSGHTGCGVLSAVRQGKYSEMNNNLLTKFLRDPAYCPVSMWTNFGILIKWHEFIHGLF